MRVAREHLVKTIMISKHKLLLLLLRNLCHLFDIPYIVESTVTQSEEGNLSMRHLSEQTSKWINK